VLQAVQLPQAATYVLYLVAIKHQSAQAPEAIQIMDLADVIV
jgi:hypothetical protein